MDTRSNALHPEAAATFEGLAAAMSRHGLAVQPQRLQSDPLYALEQIALAHATADRDLRHLAVTLFHRLTDGAPAPGRGAQARQRC
jgi:hypothetical protein